MLKSKCCKTQLHTTLNQNVYQTNTSEPLKSESRIQFSPTPTTDSLQIPAGVSNTDRRISYGEAHGGA